MDIGKADTRSLISGTAFPGALIVPLLAGLALVIGPIRGPAPAAAAPCRDHTYDIHARLDAERHIVDGLEKIVWCNTSNRPMDKLYFHLYLNAFQGPDTVFMKEGGESIRDKKMETPGGIEVRWLVARNHFDLLPYAKTDLVKGDRTQMLVPLPEPVAPGESLELTIKFRSRLPSLVARSGYSGLFNMVAQWYPKLARLEPDSRWASFPYHGLGEFYSDFAFYRLTVNAPKEYVVGSGGERVLSKIEGNRRIDVFTAERVHDVAWCAYPFFNQYFFNADGTRINILAPYGYEAAVLRHASIIRAGLDHYGRLFGRYPYPALTVIIPPRGADAASGMEYPTLFVSAGPWIPWPELYVPYPVQDEIAAHELAHQWFQAMVATNEVEEPVLDEGLAQWASYDLLRLYYGRHRSGMSLLSALSVDYFELARFWYFFPGRPQPSSTLPAYLYTLGQLTRAVYLRPALALETIGRIWSRTKLERALGRYAREYRFRHPNLAAFYAAFDAEYWPGFAAQILKPSLSGEARWGLQISGSPLGEARGRYRSDLLNPSLYENQSAAFARGYTRPLIPLLLFAAQSLLRLIGP